MEMPHRSSPVMTLRRRLGLLIFLACAARAPGQETAGTPPEDREAALLFNTASRLYRQKTWRDAAAAFGDFLKRFPSHPDAGEAHFARGFCLHRLSQHAAAVEEFLAAEAQLARPGAARQAGGSWAAEAYFYHGRSLEALAGERPAGSPQRREDLRRAADCYAQTARAARASLTKGGAARSGDGSGEGSKGGREPPAD